MPCPQPIRLKKHVMMMSMIGDGEAAPKLKSVCWEDQGSKTKAFGQVKNVCFVENLRKD
jgi:serine/threonine-protein kinase RIO1